MATDSRTTVPLFPIDAEDSVPTQGPLKPPRNYARTSMNCTLDPDLLSKEAAARALGIHPKTLDLFHRKRVGPPRLRLGRRVYFRRQLLLAWVLSREDKPASATGRPKRN